MSLSPDGKFLLSNAMDNTARQPFFFFPPSLENSPLPSLDSPARQSPVLLRSPILPRFSPFPLSAVRARCLLGVGACKRNFRNEIVTLASCVHRVRSAASDPTAAVAPFRTLSGAWPQAMIWDVSPFVSGGQRLSKVLGGQGVAGHQVGLAPNAPVQDIRDIISCLEEYICPRLTSSSEKRR